MVKEVPNRVKDKDRRNKIAQYIKDFQGRAQKSLYPFPVATDTACKKSLILDGNKTLIALYQSWPKGKRIPLVEIRGQALGRILIDFCIVHRSCPETARGKPNNGRK